ncbi:MAG: hypothetical protein ACR2GG_08745 [Gemmatimonadaceae bacterium]
MEREVEGGAEARTRTVTAAFTRRRFLWLTFTVVLIGLGLGLAWIAVPAAHSVYIPRNPALRRASLFFYPPHAGTGPARALVFFLGNDFGFWSAHQELADDLAGQGYAVVGVDVKPLLATLPDGSTDAAVAVRDSIFSAAVSHLISAARHELGTDSRPVILAGHSLGAEIAIWSAGHAAIADLIGVVAISPGARGHLRVTWSDITNAGDPDEPGSFSVAHEVATLPLSMRVALVRGDGDPYRYADSAIVAAGDRRIRLTIIPLAGHSLKSVILARFVVRHAVDWVLKGKT